LAHALASMSEDTLSITAVESDDSALNYVQQNLAGIADIEAVSARVDRWLREQVAKMGSADKDRYARATVIVDPPRSGAKADVIDSLVTLGVGEIIYVACDPVALGRDAGLLSKAGYEMVFIESWDLFPHTHHMETIATFVNNSL